MINSNPGGPLDYAMYLVLRAVAMMLHCFPVEGVMRLAVSLGDLMYRVDKRHRQRSMENLRRSFPDKSEAELRLLTRDSFRLLPMLGVEVMLTPRYLTREARIAQHLVAGKIGDVLRILVKQDTGLIFITGHYGNWEAAGYLIATMGFDVTSVARPLDNPYINDWLLGLREKKGQRIISKYGALREVTTVLDQRGAVAFIADQDAGPKGMFVDFFGRPASTYKSIGLLAMRYEVPIVIGYARRLRYGFRFQVDVQDIIHPSDWRMQRDPLRYITQRYTTAIEGVVRDEPGQYLWLHRRWKSQPRPLRATEAPVDAPVVASADVAA